MSMNLGPLFEPFELHNLTLRNRVAMAPMTRNFSPGNAPSQDVVDYYRRRAEGGVGLLITEGTTVNHPGANGYPNVPLFHGDTALAGWKDVVDAVHEAGGAISPSCGTWVRYVRKAPSRTHPYPVTARPVCFHRANPTARR